MDLIKTHEIMENELRCVQRASVNACDRDCGHCDLFTNTNEIIQAYGNVIKLIEAWQDCMQEILGLHFECLKERNPEKLSAVDSCLYILSEHYEDKEAINRWTNVKNRTTL